MHHLPMEDKIVVVTGASSGIGKVTALELAYRGATTILACRDLAKARLVRDEIRNRSGNNAVRVVQVDLRDLRSVERCSREVVDSTPRVDVLINNAGGIWPQRENTPQGFEETFAVNYLSHYALTRLLLGHLRRAADPRIINVSSDGHRLVTGICWEDLGFERRYSSIHAYGQSKLAQILFTRELALRYGVAGVTAHAVHPGVVRTNFYVGKGRPWVLERVSSIFVKLFALSEAEGAATSIHVATSPEATRCNGQYWTRSRPRRPSRAATDGDAAQRLWRLSAVLVTEAGTALPDG